ncbi:MAG: L-2-amino-thiazoline-4-carboxylic acid hydrolase [Chloroflexota bacterium]
MSGEKRSTELNEIGVLLRREIEARLAAPLIEAFAQEIGHQRAMEIVKRTIIGIARQQGRELAEVMGGCTLAHFAASLENWKKGDALSIEVMEQTETRFDFNVTRCRYAEMYRQLGMEELGLLLSCNRDKALIEGFNPQISLQRTQTIMEGASYCDFRYALKEGRIEINR